MADRPIEIVFSFDTTGSMSRYLDAVRSQLSHVISRLFDDVPRLRVGVIAHGDYCDVNIYVTKLLDLTSDPKSLHDFITEVQPTGGGDFEECYELVLRQARTAFDWRPESAGRRSLVVIGDAVPHPVSDPQNEGRIDWRQEVARLRDDLGVRIYGVLCNTTNINSVNFFKELAEATKGKFLELSEFRTITDTLLSIAYREHGQELLEDYEREVANRDKSNTDPAMKNIFQKLKNSDDRNDESTEITTLKRKATLPLDKDHLSATQPSRKRQRRKTNSQKSIDKTSNILKKPSAKRVKPNVMKTPPGGPIINNKSAKRKLLTLGMRDRRKRKPRQLREQTTLSQYKYRDLPWSNWRLGMLHERDVPQGCANLWQRRPHDLFTRRGLFSRDAGPAVYELAVQAPGSRKLWTVYCRSSLGNVGWDRLLLDGAQYQCMDVVAKGCRVYARRASGPELMSRLQCYLDDGPVTRRRSGTYMPARSDPRWKARTSNSLQLMRKEMLRHYCYAWISRRELVTRGGVHISRAAP